MSCPVYLTGIYVIIFFYSCIVITERANTFEASPHAKQPHCIVLDLMSPLYKFIILLLFSSYLPFCVLADMIANIYKYWLQQTWRNSVLYLQWQCFFRLTRTSISWDKNIIFTYCSIMLVIYAVTTSNVVCHICIYKVFHTPLLYKNICCCRT